MLVDVRFKWKLVGGNMRETRFNGYPSIEAAQNAFDDYCGAIATVYEYFEREAVATHEVSVGE